MLIFVRLLSNVSAAADFNNLVPTLCVGMPDSDAPRRIGTQSVPVWHSHAERGNEVIKKYFLHFFVLDMNKLTYLSIYAFVLFSLVFTDRLSAQSPTGIAVDSTLYRDSELYDGRDDIPTYSWLGGGFSVGYFMPDFTTFNKEIAQPFVYKDIADHVFMFGGQGFIPFPYIRNIRIGGMAYGGKTEQCCVLYESTTIGQPVMRSLRYSIGYGGLMLDYALPIRSDRFKILVGTEIGFGGIDIEAKQAYIRTKFEIAREFDSLSTNINITHTYSSHFILFKPRLTFEYAPTNFMMFNLSAGYQATVMGTWKVDGDVGLGDEGALKKVNGSGLVFNLGINVGFFQ